MPPRLHPSCGPQLLNGLENTLTRTSATAAGRPSWPQCRLVPTPSAPFSTTAPLALTRRQRNFRKNIQGKLQAVRTTTKNLASNKPHYIGRMNSEDLPFPLNPHFRSQAVLSEEARNDLYDAVVNQSMPLKAVSAQWGIDMRRIAAVVRLKEIEKNWTEEGTPLAKPYARAVMQMLPKAKLSADRPFEEINAIHVHMHTMQQLFVPTSESRHFTRDDAAAAFGHRILTPDKKLRIPELIDFETDVAAGMTQEEASKRFLATATLDANKKAYRERRALEAEEANKVRVHTGRFEFRFEGISVDSAGPDGRAREAVGARYGVPFNDRRRGVSKIPTKVD